MYSCIEPKFINKIALYSYVISSSVILVAVSYFQFSRPYTIGSNFVFTNQEDLYHARQKAHCQSWPGTSHSKLSLVPTISKKKSNLPKSTFLGACPQTPSN